MISIIAAGGHMFLVDLKRSVCYQLSASLLLLAASAAKTRGQNRATLLKGPVRGIMVNILIIGLGGFLGAVARYGVALWIGQRWGRNFPLGTFVINITGSMLIGFLMPLLTERFLANPQWRLFLAVGFLGAYTTFSTFEYETGALLKDGEWLMACGNVILSVIVGFAALKVGETVARSI